MPLKGRQTKLSRFIDYTKIGFKANMNIRVLTIYITFHFKYPFYSHRLVLPSEDKSDELKPTQYSVQFTKGYCTVLWVKNTVSLKVLVGALV